MDNNIEELEIKLQEDLKEIEYLVKKYNRFKELINEKIIKAKELKLDIQTQKDLENLPDDIFPPEE